jgi:hyperosmotically inducible periplasmic protein
MFCAMPHPTAGDHLLAEADCRLANAQKETDMKRITKTFSAIALTVAAALASPVATYAVEHDGDRSSPKTFAKDATITAKIKAKMAKERGVSATHIRVDTDRDGIVTLSGRARSREEADKAAAIARHVEGVASVQNHIEVVAHR